MIQVLELKRAPLAAGERRPLVLDGDAPFQVSTSCFVDSPPPSGFRPCAQCSTDTVAARQPLVIEAGAEFWTGKKGTITISITDAVGDSLNIELKILSDTENRPRLAVAGA
jgi:hypothetical protein